MTLTPLEQIIVARIQQEGPIPFADYMRMALYDPQYGYYTSGPAKMGWEGDYYTSTDVSRFFAHCMGRQLYQMWEKLSRPGHFHVIEQGAGRGDLAKGVCTWAEREAPDFHAALDYCTEDIHFGQDALTTKTQTAITPSVILSNELVDAFPVHIVEIRDKKVYEVYVGQQDGRFYEVLAEPSLPEVAAYLDTYNIPWPSFPDGWRAEINLDALYWIRKTAARLRRGFILAIDYGEKARALYTSYRPQGTLACYFQHRLSERPLLLPGQQDITAHVNFSALIDEGRKAKLRLSGFMTQKLWLEQMGILDELEQVRRTEFAAMDTERASDKGQIALFQWYNLKQRVDALLDMNGMGNFKVLILRR